MIENATEFRELVRAKSDIVAVIGQTRAVQPKRGGREYVCLCPFHDDHNPSMTINPERQTFRCWVCDEGGDVFSYVMKSEGVDFPTALQMLADQAGLEMPKQAIGSQTNRGPAKADVYAALMWAKRMFHRCLLEDPLGETARNYLYDRGFHDETIVEFELGYHPEDWNWLLNQSQNQFSKEVLTAARLIGERNNDRGYYDYFVDRVLFPIGDERARTVAFGGRVLPGRDQPNMGKYWNSPEGLVFPKSKTLFALDHAKEAIKAQKQAIVTEGYTDCISLHQAGFKETVATLGTALTESHVALLKRFCSRVVLVYDGDQAGQSAAERSLPRFISQDIDLRILTLPSGQDPADFIASSGASAFRELIAQAPDAWDFQYHRLAERFDLTNDHGTTQIMEQMLTLLAQVPRISATPREDRLLSRLQHALRIEEPRLRQVLSEKRQQRRMQPEHRPNDSFMESSFQNSNEEPEPVAIDPYEQDVKTLIKQRRRRDAQQCELMACLLIDPELCSVVYQCCDPELFPNRTLQALFRTAQSCWEEHQNQLNANELFQRIYASLEHESLKQFSIWLTETAQQVELQQKLQKLVSTASPEGEEIEIPELLRDLLQGLEWTRAELQHQSMTRQLIQQEKGSESLNDQSLELLQQATEFHRQRVLRKNRA